MLDSNIWVSERMLYTALGSATLHALTRSGARIILPEIVTLEVNHVLLEQTDKAADSIQKSSHLLRQISGHHMSILAPSQAAVKTAIDQRWTQLSGLLDPMPFTLDHARAALNRIVKKMPPCGPNNEQFRDCCIWQCAIDQAGGRPVHLISNDHAFYEGGNRSAALASPLAAELKAINRSVTIYPNLNAFLGTMDSEITQVDEDTISAAIVAAVAPEAREVASNQGGEFELGALRNIQITGYATPKESIVAVSFIVTFDISRSEHINTDRQRPNIKMRLTGGCSYDPNAKVVSEIEISEWSKSLDSESGGSWGTYSSSQSISRQFSEGNIRVL